MIGSGCARPPAPTIALATVPNADTPASRGNVVKPERATIRQSIGQPGAIQAFEQAPIFAKIAGYVQKWHVDLGDRVKAGDLLAELSAPELVEEWKQKQALVTQAEKALAMARARVATSAALLREAEAGLTRAEANQRRWRIEKDRIAALSKGKIIDEQSDIETWNQYQSAEASLKEAQARIGSARAALQESEAGQDKAQADIGVARADQQRLAALVSYLKLRAPFAGIITKRTIDTGHFVQPATGVKGEPLFVVERSDTVRVFVEVPESESAWVHPKAAAEVRVPVLRNEIFPGKVTRTAWTLSPTTRTLLAEIDLPNPHGRLRPGWYAFATVTAEHSNVLTLPSSAVLTQGEITRGYQSYCFRVENGKLRKTPVEIGVRDAQRVEVLKKRIQAPGSADARQWVPFTGDEEVLRHPNDTLVDGQPLP
jgi:multidrug efflux pump subunit AcrA (membrane-fusion protein)